MGDPENGGRFTVKKYHSAKTVSVDAWQHERIKLLPLNPDYGPILVAPYEGSDMVVGASGLPQSTEPWLGKGKIL